MKLLLKDNYTLFRHATRICQNVIVLSPSEKRQKNSTHNILITKLLEK